MAVTIPILRHEELQESVECDILEGLVPENDAKKVQCPQSLGCPYKKEGRFKNQKIEKKNE